MSRIGNKPIPFSDKVQVEVKDRRVSVKGPKATLEHVLPDLVDANVDGQVLQLTRANESRQAKAFHGLARSLLANMVQGVTEGFAKELEIRGVGYRAQVRGRQLVLSLGYSHPIEFDIPEGIEISVTDNTRVRVEGADRQQVGQVAATLRDFRPPEVYKGKGVRYVDEYVIQKQGKTV